MTTQRQTSRASMRRPFGGWLVTYADLMTILVCFFVLIISYSIQDQVKMEVVAGSMREAFGVAEERRYAGDIRLDGTPEQRQPGNIIQSAMPTANGITDTLAANPAAGADGSVAAYAAARDDRKRLDAAKKAIEGALLTHPLLKDAADAVMIRVEKKGLQILIIDSDARPMFALGGAEPTAPAIQLIREITQILKPLPNQLTVLGHADASGSGAYSPFDLTADRANAARRIMEAAGLPGARISGIAGKGAADPLYPEDPYAAGNRRVEIRLEYAAPLLPRDRKI